MITPFVIVPYVSAGPIRLGMDRSQLHALLGPPDHSKKSRFGARIIDRWNTEDLTVISSDAAGSVQEVGFGAKQSEAQVAGFKLFDRDGPTAYRDLCLADGTPKEHVGFTILFKFGVTLDGFHVTEQDDRAVTVFAKGVRDENDSRLTAVKI
ncbi:hypothetical protein [Paraburkholderia phosphatilytica]|uniref:hypothetical protein n=1 Tax=Paraburkholderia phosphatilytica TaxID=2282883 RepID=UPI000E50CA9F|nr:hypothetical protein [Paraburkholderia phosphatilytica]